LLQGEIIVPAGLCFTPDHEDEHLNIASLNRSDRAALATSEDPGVSGLCFAPDHEDDDLSLKTLSHADRAYLALV
jgi:hypothetical protein